MFIIFGLGNPGKRYASTRHNMGFMAVETLARQHDIKFWRDEGYGYSAVYYEKGEKVMLVKPQTYMNRSGLCVRALTDYYHVPLENVAVIYDDIDLPLGQLRVRKKGGPGTHNGMRSIIDYVESGEFPRFRLGIGPKNPQWDLADFVLAQLTGEEKELISALCQRTADAVQCYVTDGIESAMNRFNQQS